MTLILADRVKETTATTGTATYTLAGAVNGFESFASIGDGNTTYYACTLGSDFEVGIGTYTSSGTTLGRTTILQSTNNDNAVNWGSGEKIIFCTQPAEKAVFRYASGHIIALDGRNLTNVNAQTLDSLDSTQFLRSDTADTMSGSLTITGNTEIQGGLLDIKNAGSQSELRMYCESNNAHYAALKAPAHADFSGNVDITLPATAGTLALTSSNITGNAATATTATNSDTVDNKHIAVVSALPASPDANTIYFIT